MIVLAVSSFTILNFSSVECLVFAEASWMCLGILLSVVAATKIINNTVKDYIISLILLIIATICYQATSSLFIPLALCFVVFNNKEKIGNAFKQGITVLIIYGLAMIPSMLIMKMLNQVLELSDRTTYMPTIANIIMTYVTYLKYVVIDTIGMLPRYLYLAIISGITISYLIYIVKFKEKPFNIIYYILILLSAILIVILPIVILEPSKQYIEPRMMISVGASIGILLIFLIINTNVLEKNIFKDVFKYGVIGIFVLNSMYIVQASAQLVAVNQVDRNFAKSIIGEIKDYENSSGNKIKKIGIYHEPNFASYYDGGKMIRGLSIKSLSIEWAIMPVLETYGQEKVERIREIPQEIIENNFKDKDWNYYSSKQLVFDKETLYICVY